MNGTNSTNTMPVDENKSKNLIRSDYANIMVKVDTDVYHLDRLQIALKSDYFEKILLTENFCERNSDLIELPIMDSDLFNVIVDVIYGEEVESILTTDNCVSIFMAMDYLQMKIDLYVFVNFIQNDKTAQLMSNTNIFKLYDYILENRHFKALLSPILKYLSRYFNDGRNNEKFLSLSLNRLTKIILMDPLSETKGKIESIREFSQTCVEWICYDLDNRLAHFGELVNAVRYKIKQPHPINDKKLDINFGNVCLEMKREKILRRFLRLLFWNGEIKNGCIKIKTSPKEDFPKYSDDTYVQNKLDKFLENGEFYDITVRVEKETYRLHRFILKSRCGYFEELFSTELSVESNTQVEGIESDKDKEYLLLGVDQTTFKMLIKFMYLNENIDLTLDNIISVMKVDDILN